MNQRAFLARVAAPLEPDREPFYVSAPTEPGELVGWYVVVAGRRVPLGSNVYLAQRRLEQLAGGGVDQGAAA